MSEVICYVFSLETLRSDNVRRSVMSALPAFSQQAFVQGVVTDSDGKIVMGAVVGFDSAETRNHIEAKSDKKGHYIQNMKPGVYAVTVKVDGVVRQSLKQYEAVGGNGDPLDFKLKPVGQQPPAQLSAAAPPAARQGRTQGRK